MEIVSGDLFFHIELFDHRFSKLNPQFSASSTRPQI